MIRDRKKREIDAQTRSLLERANALLARAVATSGCLDS